MWVIGYSQHIFNAEGEASQDLPRSTALLLCRGWQWLRLVIHHSTSAITELPRGRTVCDTIHYCKMYFNANTYINTTFCLCFNKCWYLNLFSNHLNYFIFFSCIYFIRPIIYLAFQGCCVMAFCENENVELVCGSYEKVQYYSLWQFIPPFSFIM